MTPLLPAPLPDPSGLPTSYRIGGLLISPNVVLAPMEGVTDVVFRRLVRGIGGTGMTCTEFIPAGELHQGALRASRAAELDPDERPVCVQIYGRDPAVMADGARAARDMGADVVDINMGCPSKKVCAHSGGSSLMKDLPLAAEIVRAVRAAGPGPLTVKMRSGFDAERRNAPELAWICQQEGADAVTVHWRTRADGYGGLRAVDKIAEVVARLSIPALGNGDIIDIGSASAMLRETGCAGLMIGRGAIRNPWLPLQVSQWLRGEAPVSVDAAEKKRALLRYFETISEAIPRERSALGRMKMLSNHFTRDLPGGEELRSHLLRSQSRAEAEDHIHTYFASLGAL